MTAAVAVTMLMALLTCAEQACAQGTMGAVPDPISSRDVERYAHRLDLSRHQRIAVESMHDLYREEFGQLRDGDIEKFLGSTRNLGGGLGLLMDRAATRKAFKDLDDILNKIKAVDNRFFDQMQSVLTEEQIARLSQVRQMRERVRYRSGLSRLTAFVNPGVQVDLSEIAADLNLSPQERSQFEPALAQYESSLTAASRKLYEATSSLVLEALDSLQTQGLTEEAMRDPERRGQMFQNFRTVLGDIQLKLAAKAAELNDLNRRWLRTLAAALAPENGRSLREEYTRRAYPELRGASATASRAFAIVLKFAELTDDQRQSVAAMASEYHSAWDRLMEQAMDQVDSNRKGQTFFDMDRDTRRAQAEELAALRDKRTKLSDAAVENLRAMLAPEHIERMDKLLAQNKETEEDITGATLVAPVGGGAGFAVATRVGGPADADDAALSDPFLPRAITRSDVERYAARMNLAGEQRELLNSLHADYSEDYRELEEGPIKEVKQAQRSLWSMNPGGGAVAPPTPQAIESLHVLRKRALVSILELDKKFFDNVQIVLGDSVEAAKVQRLHNARLRDIYSRTAQQSSVFGGLGGRREFRGGPGGRAMRMFGGASAEAGIDLAAIADQLQLAPTDPAAFDSALSEYEASALASFQKMFDAALNMQLGRDKMIAQAAGENRDGERGGRIGEGFRGLMEGDGRVAAEARRAVTTLNRATLARLLNLLSADAAAELRRAYNHKAFPEVFRDPRSAQPHLDAALGLGSLTDQQRAQIHDIALEFRAQYEELCDKLIELEAAEEPLAAGPPQNRDWQSFGERLRAREKIEFDRNDLNDRTLSKLRAALNDQQIQQLGGLQPLPRDED